MPYFVGYLKVFVGRNLSFDITKKPHSLAKKIINETVNLFMMNQLSNLRGKILAVRTIPFVLFSAHKYKHLQKVPISRHYMYLTGH